MYIRQNNNSFHDFKKIDNANYSSQQSQNIFLLTVKYLEFLTREKLIFNAFMILFDRY